MPSGPGWVYVRKKKRAPGDGARWPEKAKIQAVTTFIATGNITHTAELCNIPRPTIIEWMKTAWWQKMYDDLQYQDHVELDGRLKKVMEKALDVVSDRLENGDFFFDQKTGRTTRVPVKLRDVHKVTTDMIDKRSLLRKEGKQIINQEDDKKKAITGDHLVQLAKVFADLAKGNTNTTNKEKNEVIEGDYVTLNDLGIEEK
jgi:hypothetical protein